MENPMREGFATRSEVEQTVFLDMLGKSGYRAGADGHGPQRHGQAKGVIPWERFGNRRIRRRRMAPTQTDIDDDAKAPEPTLATPSRDDGKMQLVQPENAGIEKGRVTSRDALIQDEGDIDMRERIYESFDIDPGLYGDLIADAQRATERLRELHPLSQAEQNAIESYEESFLTRFTYNSAAIEGSTLTLRDTALVLEGEFEPSDDARARDVFAAMGIRDGCLYADRASNRGRELDENLIRDIHERTALDCQPMTRGATGYRRSISRDR